MTLEGDVAKSEGDVAFAHRAPHGGGVLLQMGRFDSVQPGQVRSGRSQGISCRADRS